MKTSDKGRQLIEEFEGCILKAYNDGVGVCTIGYGHTNSAGQPFVHYGMEITRADADAILANDLRAVEDEIGRIVKAPLNQNQFDALVSFVFNLGSHNAAGLIKRLNSGDYAAIPLLMLQYNHAGGNVLDGLTRRRRAEAALFKAPVVAEKPPLIPFPPPPDIPAPEPQAPQKSILVLIIEFIVSLFRK